MSSPKQQRPFRPSQAVLQQVNTGTQFLPLCQQAGPTPAPPHPLSALITRCCQHPPASPVIIQHILGRDVRQVVPGVLQCDIQLRADVVQLLRFLLQRPHPARSENILGQMVTPGSKVRQVGSSAPC